MANCDPCALQPSLDGAGPEFCNQRCDRPLLNVFVLIDVFEEGALPLNAMARRMSAVKSTQVGRFWQSKSCVAFCAKGFAKKRVPVRDRNDRASMIRHHLPASHFGTISPQNVHIRPPIDPLPSLPASCDSASRSADGPRRSRAESIHNSQKERRLSRCASISSCSANGKERRTNPWS